MDTPTDALQAVSHADPYPWYAGLREGPPLSFHASLGMWVALRADVIHEALAHPGMRVRPQAEPVPPALAGRAVGDLFGRWVRMNDGDAAHAAPKAGLKAALAGVDPSEVARRAAEASARSPADWNSWVSNVAVETVAGLLGFAEADLPQVADDVAALVAAVSPRATARDRDGGDAAAGHLLESLALRLARAAPGRLVDRVRRAPWPSQPALLANLAGLMTQAGEATAGLLGNAVVALARGERLGAGELPGFVDEVMRHDPPVQNTRRYTAEPTRLAHVDLPVGAAVLLVLGAAGRDPALNADGPDVFRARRAARRTPGFGWGPHACPGALLARGIAVAALTQRLDAGPPLPLSWGYRPSVNARIPTFPSPSP